MAWFYLALAGLLEIGWAVGLKYTQGFTRLGPSLLAIGSIALSVGPLAQAVRTIPIGAGYAVWTGIRATGAAILEIAFFSEAATTARIACIGLIAAGVIGLKFTS